MKRKLLYIYIVATACYFVGLVEASLLGTFAICSVICFFVPALAVFGIVSQLLEGRINVFNVLAYGTLFSYMFPLGLAFAFDFAAVRGDVNDYFFYVFEILIMTFPVLLFGSTDKQDVVIFDYASSEKLRANLLPTALVIAGLASFELMLLLTQQWTYGSLVVAQTEQASPLVILAGQITVGLAGLCGFVSGVLSRHARKLSISEVLVLGLAMATLILQALWWLPAGRRFLVVQMLLGVVTFVAARNDFKFSSKSFLKLAVWLGILGPIGFLLTRVFVTLRMLAWARGGARIDLFELLSQLGSIDPNSVSAYDSQAGARALILDSYDVVRRYMTTPLGGLEAVTQLLNSIPSIFFDKVSLLDRLGGVNERLWTNSAGVPYSDYAQTVLLEGYVDFSYFGFFVYAFFLSVMFKVVLRIGSRIGGLPMLLLYFYGSLYTFFQVETVLSSVLGFFRTSIVLFLVGFVLQTYSMLPAKLSKQRGRISKSLSRL